MKYRLMLALIVAVCLGAGERCYAQSLGTSFAYQGKLNDGESPANGLYDFVFEVFDDPNIIMGTPVGLPVSKDDVQVNEGHFTITLDFGFGVFDGDGRWLEIRVRQAGSVGGYTTLIPRQTVTPAPYALYAVSSGSGGGGDGDTDPTNELQTLGLAGNTLSISSSNSVVLPTGGSGSDSDWTISGSNMYSGVSGNVGVGTASPAYDLDIFGSEGFRVVEDAGADSSFTFGEFGVTIWDYANIEFARIDQDSGPSGYLRLSDLGNPKVQLHSDDVSYINGGNVGIGTSSPGAKLDVSGDINASSVYKIGGNTVLSVAESGNTFVGIEAGTVNTGNYNTFSGYAAGHSNTTGYRNTFSGNGAGFCNTTGYSNTFLGNLAGYSNTTGFRNVFLGYRSGLNETGSNKLYIDISDTSTPLIHGDFSKDRMGINRVATANTLEVGGNASKSTAGSWLANSDARIKTDIQTVNQALDTLDKVRLVSFKYTDDYRNQHSGIEHRAYLNVVAQEFAEVFPDYVKNSGEKLSNGQEILQVDTYPLIIYTAAAVQELHEVIKEKDVEIETLITRFETENQLLKLKLDALEKNMTAIMNSIEGGLK